MTHRIGCVIPGCRRTFKREADDTDDTEVMCRRHWRMGDTRLRERHKRLRKRIRKVERLVRRHAIRAKGDARIDRLWERLHLATYAAWQAVREDATIKAAFGVENAPRQKPRQADEAQP